jgi:PilZ domain
MEQERRRTPRYPFAATAELVETSSGAKLTLKVNELSLNGCYVETPNVLEKGSGVLLKIYREPHYFEAPATVMYANPNQGMGLTFHDVKPFFAGVLQKWLLAAMVSRKVPHA